MSVRAVRALVFAFFVAYAVAVTWPGAVPFNRVRPLILGLPFNLAWGAAWIVAGGLVLWWLDRSEARVRGEPRPDAAGPGAGATRQERDARSAPPSEG